jgi:GTPase
MQEVTGNTAGLAPAELRLLERIYRRRVAPTDVVGPELAAFLCECSATLSRQVGILVDRRGQVEHVVVGDATRLFLPDVGRLRAARGRFRGLRLVHTHLQGEGLTRDDLTDLALLRFDLVCAIVVEPGGLPGDAHIGHLIPAGPTSAEPWVTLPPRPARQLELDFLELIRNLEAEFARVESTLAPTDTGKDRALVVVPTFGKRQKASEEGRVAEIVELCKSAGVQVLEVLTQHREEPDARYVVGKGKLEQVVLRAMQLGAEVLVIDAALTPSQAQAVNGATELRIVDRTMLILDIFARRAHSADGKLQVELAQLRYSLPRLVHKDTLRSRLGVGRQGPGETALEIDRRRAREKIRRLEDRIEHISRHRAVQRAQRESSDLPVVSIVGYTNAGKSTLFNALTDSDVVAKDQMFSTLDPTHRRLRNLPAPAPPVVLLSDTVGFIRDLPPDLARAFRATLEGLGEADVLLHVIDGADPDHEQQIDAVTRILGELELGERPRITVVNKADLLAEPERLRLARELRAVVVSARDPSTLPALRQAIAEALDRTRPAAATTSSASPSESPSGP